MECSDEGASQPEQFWVCDGERPAACRLCFLSEPPPYPLAYLPSLPCVQLPPPALWGTDLVVLYHFHPTFSHTVTACRQQQQQQHPQQPPPSTSPNSKYDQYAIFSSSLSSLPPTPQTPNSFAKPLLYLYAARPRLQGCQRGAGGGPH